MIDASALWLEGEPAHIFFVCVIASRDVRTKTGSDGRSELHRPSHVT